MNDMIGFDRRVQLHWLEATVALYRNDPDPGMIAQELQRQLSHEIRGSEARRKTITVLLRLWVNVPNRHVSLRDEALLLATEVSSQERLWLHWGMALLAYPFFRDVAGVVGQIGTLRGILSHAGVQRRMVETWGERTTLRRATQRLLRSFVDWRVLQDAGQPGIYAVVAARETENQALALWLLDCALRATGADQVSVSKLAQLTSLFPFDLLDFIKDVRNSQRFEVDRQGLDMEMVSPTAAF